MNLQTNFNGTIKTGKPAPTHWSVRAPQPGGPPTAANTTEDGEAIDIWPRPEDDPQSIQARSQRAKAELLGQSWLARDPFEWVGRRIRSKKTGTVFTVRNAFRNGRVELERSWMTYSYTVEVIRADFETNS
jgi:hypothetical protein